MNVPTRKEKQILFLQLMVSVRLLPVPTGLKMALIHDCCKPEAHHLQHKQRRRVQERPPVSDFLA